VSEALFEPERIFEVLERRGVEYVLIGGLAGVLYGSPAVTFDTDVCPARDRANLERLAAALREMEARIRSEAEPEGLPLAIDARFLSAMGIANLTTKFGDFDISFEPSGFEGYDELALHAVDLAVGKLTVKVAALTDVIRSKEAANRPKDHATLPILYALEDEIAKRDET
jgi:hypothetical protein